MRVKTFIKCENGALTLQLPLKFLLQLYNDVTDDESYDFIKRFFNNLNDQLLSVIDSADAFCRQESDLN